LVCSGGYYNNCYFFATKPIFNPPLPDEYNHVFNIGDIVYTKVNCLKGMVVSAALYHGTIYIRFYGDTQYTTDSFLGGYHKIDKKPYDLIDMQEFEVSKQCADSYS